ncbi:MAG: DUF3011 domain-containing protein, partial [Planctomycetes bacterium]|nr:DUF3011 domain-containing protein [Planctomycetota bacterium]
MSALRFGRLADVVNLVCINALAFALAEPAFAATADVMCNSEAGQREYCAADTSAGVVLTQQSSRAPCLLGKTWGYDDSGIWVAEGCAGRFSAAATAETAAHSADVDGSSFDGEIEVYSRLRGHVAFYNSEAEIQDNASWIGLRANAGKKIRAFAATEWAVNIIQNDQLFNPGAATNTEFNLETNEIDEFALRLGYVGVDMGSLGTLTLGKQWGVHYDVASYTADRVYVFGGGTAALAYPAQSDGGETGTGRADRALIYRNSFLGMLDIGVQTQFRNASNDEFVDGLGVSARAQLTPALQLGISYTGNFYDRAFIDGIDSIDGDGKYLGVGARWATEAIELGVVWASQENGDLTGIDDPADDSDDRVPIGFDGDGVELYGKINFGKAALLAGFVNYDTDARD